MRQCLNSTVRDYRRVCVYVPYFMCVHFNKNFQHVSSFKEATSVLQITCLPLLLLHSLSQHHHFPFQRGVENLTIQPVLLCITQGYFMASGSLTYNHHNYSATLNYAIKLIKSAAMPLRPERLTKQWKSHEDGVAASQSQRLDSHDVTTPLSKYDGLPCPLKRCHISPSTPAPPYTLHLHFRFRIQQCKASLLYLINRISINSRGFSAVYIKDERTLPKHH